jgi:uncharacterized membrane protein
MLTIPVVGLIVTLLVVLAVVVNVTLAGGFDSTLQLSIIVTPKVALIISDGFCKKFGPTIIIITLNCNKR